MADTIIRIHELRNYLGERWVHDGLNLEIERGEIIGIIGGSGCGKTTLLRSILMLQPFTSGVIEVFGENIAELDADTALQLQQRWGVMFQSGALFSSLPVLHNVMFPLHEFTSLDMERRREIALLKIGMTGLELDAAMKYPSELSGGMRKRAAMARAIAMDPELIFLDEPTAGLDPQSAGELDDLILHLRDNLGLTVVMITHDLDTLWRVPDRIVFIGEGKILAAEPMRAVASNPHPAIRAYFSGPRFEQREAEFIGTVDGT